MTKHGSPKPHKNKAQSDKHNPDAERQSVIHPMSGPPDEKPPKLDDTNTSQKDTPPPPSGLLPLVKDWLRSRKGAPREKSKVADWVLVALTILVAIAAFWSAFIFQEQLKEARRATEIQQRPWLSVEAQPTNGLLFVNGQQPVLVLKFSVKNVGHSIAKTVQIDAKMFPTSPEFPVATDAAQRQRELCDHPKISQVGSFDLFPSEQPAERELDISALPSSVAAQAVSSTGDKPRKFVGFYVVGCATYRFSFGPEFHQTRFAYHLLGPVLMSKDHRPPMTPKGMPIMTGFELGVNIAKDQLGMTQELFAQNDAN